MSKSGTIFYNKKDTTSSKRGIILSIVAIILISATHAYAAPNENNKPEEMNSLDRSLAELEKELKPMDYHNKEQFEEKRKKRALTGKEQFEEAQRDALREMIIDDMYLKQMNDLKKSIRERAHIGNYQFQNFEEGDWLKRYKRDLENAYLELKVEDKIVENNVMKQRVKRDLQNHDADKENFQKQLANFEINQENIRNMIDKGIALNMQRAMKISIDYALKSYVNTTSNLDESVQRFFIMKQEYMNLIDKWYHGVVIDLPNYLKSQERKKINLSFDDEQPTPEEREKLDKLNIYEKKVDREFAEVGIYYGKVLLNNYCDLDDLFYKHHRDNNHVNIQNVFTQANTEELLKREKLM